MPTHWRHVVSPVFSPRLRCMASMGGCQVGGAVSTRVGRSRVEHRATRASAGVNSPAGLFLPGPFLPVSVRPAFLSMVALYRRCEECRAGPTKGVTCEPARRFHGVARVLNATGGDFQGDVAAAWIKRIAGFPQLSEGTGD